MTSVDEKEREVLEVTVLFWVVAVFLVLAFMVCFCNATAKDRDVADRREDLEVGVFLFACFIILVLVFKGV